MAVPDPEHLFEQAERLIAPPPAGPPREVDLRRAYSAAYYGLFHAIAAAAADLFVGSTSSTALYVLVYRSVEHRRLKDLCLDLDKDTVADKYKPYTLPQTENFGDDIRHFAAAVVQLQEKRHKYDYDPTATAVASDAEEAVKAARTALERFYSADPVLRDAFLALLFIKPRKD